MKATSDIILFTRFPEAGSTKTRLIPALGAQGAAVLQRRMTEYVVRQARKAAGATRGDLLVAYEGGEARTMRDWLGPGITYAAQRQGNLGERMADAFRERFRAGAGSAMVIGSDCPGLNSDYLLKAQDALQHHDVVIGPAADGGYVLLGLRPRAFDMASSSLFEGMPWGTHRVFQRTRQALKQTSLKVCVLAELWDVDTADDVERLRSLWGEPSPESPEPALTVVIPTLNEEAHIADAIASARQGANVNVVVSDGHSTDDTVRLARQHNAEVMQISGGRAAQLNAGARATDDAALLFLHADTHLPFGYDSRVRETLAQFPQRVGAFRLRIEGHGASLRMIEAGANWRARVRSLPYGDQGLFMRRELFDTLGGFPEFPIMDDYEFVRRARSKAGVALLPVPVSTSPRRWQRTGPWRAVLINQLLVAAYLLGTSPERLAGWYRR